MRLPAWSTNRRVRLVAAGGAASLAIIVSGGLALAVFGSSASVGGNTFTTTILAPPTGPAAVGGANIVLTWTATTSTFATGTNVLRSSTSGGPYTQIAQVTPRTTATYTDSPVAGTYYYVLQSYFQNWVSVNTAQVTAGVSTNTGYLSCSANAADAGGDGNGYETAPASACAADSVFAVDANSGTGTSTLCTSAAKDKHRFYNNGFAIPASSVINGIEVRLDALKSGTGTVPKLCVQLSWDAGTTWTTAKNTATITGAKVTYTLGTTADNWGRTWASTEFSNANFRLRVIDVDNVTTQTFQLDYVAVRVTYTPP